MQLDFLYSTEYVFVISACLAMLVLCLSGFALGKELTRPVVIAIGLCFIAVGVLGHVTVLDMAERAQRLLEQGLLSKSTFDRFDRYQVVFAYFFPAISAAIGTNIISDALVKHHTYTRPFSPVAFLCDLWFAILSFLGFVLAAFIGIIFIITLPVGPTRRYLYVAAPRAWRWSQLKLLKVSIIARSRLGQSKAAST